MSSDSEHLVSAEELSALLSIPLQSIWRAARLGRIPAYRLGQLYRFDPAEVLEAMRGSSAPADGGDGD
jgi:excisionase family DNA binding protein